MAFTDELASGVVPSGSPELAASFGLTPSQAAGWTLVAFQLLALFLEPPLLALLLQPAGALAAAAVARRGGG